MDQLLATKKITGTGKPSPIGAPVPDTDREMYDPWHYIVLISWTLCLFIGFVLTLYAYLAPDWITRVASSGISVVRLGGGAGSGSSASNNIDHKIGLVNREPSGMTGPVGHPAWVVTAILLAIAMVLQIATISQALALWYKDKDETVKRSRKLNFWANVLFYLALLVWPFGLDNDGVGCTSQAQTKMYYVCDPWDLDTGAYILIVGCFFMTVSQLISTRVRTRSQRRKALDIKNMYERDRQSFWFTQMREAMDESEDAYSMKDFGENEAVQTRHETRRRGSVKETSFWDAAFEDVDPAGYLDVEAEVDGESDGDEDGAAAAAMMQ